MLKDGMYETKIVSLEGSTRPGSWLKNKIDIALLNRIESNINYSEVCDSVVKVLEIGVGNGRFAELLLKKHPNVSYFGVEPVRTLRLATMKRLEQFGARQTISDSYLPEINDVPGGEFDVCLMLHLLEHATNPAIAREWLLSIFEKLKKGGRVMILCPNIFDYQAWFYDGDWTHAYPTTTKRIADLGLDVSFAVVEAIDLRANSGNLFIKGALLGFSRLFPVSVMDFIGKKLFNTNYLGMGIKAAVFWRNSWVVLEKP